MATRQPDPSSFFNPDVAERQFTVGKKGFDQDEVRGFLRAVAARLARMDEEHRRLQTRNAELERGVDAAHESAYGRVAARFADVIRAADGSAGVTREAVTESERLVAEARAQAGHILSNARAQAGRAALPAPSDAVVPVADEFGSMEEELDQLSRRSGAMQPVPARRRRTATVGGARTGVSGRGRAASGSSPTRTPTAWLAHPSAFRRLI